MLRKELCVSVRWFMAGWRLFIGIFLAALAVSCAPAGLIPASGSSGFVVKEYPLVEQSRDNPTHPEFQDWVPQDALAHRAASSNNKVAMVGASDAIHFGLANSDLTQAEDQGQLLSATIAGKPFYLFNDNGEARMDYNGKVLPYMYDLVVTGKSGNLSIFNPGSNGRMVWFYALRDGLWYYVEAGNW